MNKRKLLKITIFAAAFILVGIGVFLVAKHMIKNKRLQQCEDIIDGYVTLINERDLNCFSYTENNSLDSAIKYEEYYFDLLCNSENYNKDIYYKSYRWYMWALQQFYGEDFKVDYKIKSKEVVGRSREKKIQKDLRLQKTYSDYYVDEYLAEQEISLAYYGASEDEIEKCAKLYKDFLDEVGEVEVSEAYRFIVEITITGRKTETFEWEMYFGMVNDKLILIGYSPEEPEEEGEFFYFSQMINPLSIYQEVSYEIINEPDIRGKGCLWDSDINSQYGEWVQNDGSGNTFFYGKDEEIGAQVIKYTDSTGKAIEGFEGINYLDTFSSGYYQVSQIPIYAEIDENGDGVGAPKKIIDFLWSTRDKMLLVIDGEEVEFLRVGEPVY